MPRVGNVGQAVIYVYAGDHNPPHFHVRLNGMEARVTIVGRVVMNQDLPPSVLKDVLEWAEANEAKLALKWLELNEERRD